MGHGDTMIPSNHKAIQNKPKSFPLRVGLGAIQSMTQLNFNEEEIQNLLKIALTSTEDWNTLFTNASKRPDYANKIDKINELRSKYNEYTDGSQDQECQDAFIEYLHK